MNGKSKLQQLICKNSKQNFNQATEEIGNEGIMIDSVLIISSAKTEFKGGETSAILNVQQQGCLNKISLSTNTSAIDFTMSFVKQEDIHSQRAGDSFN